MKNMMNFYLIWKYFAASIFFLMLSNNVFSQSFSNEPGVPDKSSYIAFNSSDELSFDRGLSEILFIDGNVSDITSLINDAKEGIEIIRLEKGVDGVQQITDILRNRHNLSAVHIVSHGSSGLLRLGNASLSSYTIDRYNSQLISWGQSLTETGDLLLYGCNVAQGKDGHDFINKLSQLTGADVAASEDMTGASVLGGNWKLEAINSGGSLKTSSLNLIGYPNLLAVTAATITSITTDTGISSTDMITSDATLIFGGLYTSGGGTNNLYIWIDNVYKGAITVSANQTNVAWTYNYTATTLTGGNHTIVINTSNTVIATGQLATKTITIDTTLPTSLAAVPVVLTSGSNSGSLLDNTTNVNKPVVSVNLTGISGLTAGETVQIIDASYGNLVVGSYVILASDLTAGTWNRTTQNIISSTLALGVHNLVANIIDVAGNLGTSSTTVLALTIIDQTAPIPNKASAGGNILTLAFTETGSGLKSTSVPLTSNFVLTQSGLPISVTAVAVNSTTNEVTLTLGATVSTSVNALLSYTPSGTANDIQDVSLNKVVAFSGFYVSTSLPVYNVNNNPLLFNSSTAKVGTGKAIGDIVLFDHIITINGQAIDAIITTVALTNITINGYETGVSAPVNTNFFETDMKTTAAGGNAEFRIDFIKNGTFNATTHVGSGVILQNVSLNSWDIDAASAGQFQFQEFGGFAQYTVATNTTLNQTNMGSNFVHFQNTDGNNDTFTSTIAANGSATSDKYRVKALYAAISSFGIKMGDVANGSTVYFYLDFSPGPAFASGKTYVEPTVNPATTADTTPTLTGTYGNGVTGSPAVTVTSMSVKVNGVTYTTATGLIYNNGNWSLTTGTLPNGIYDVVAWVTYSDGTVLYDPTFSELVIDTSLGFDNTPPTLTSIERFNPPAQSISSSDLAIQNWVEFKLTFSEPVTQNITADDFQTSGLGGVGTLISQVTQIGASVYTIRVSNIPATDWDYLGIDLAATNNIIDNSGNLLTNLTPTSAIDEFYLWANQAPIAVNDVATTNEDNPVAFNVTTNDTDIDGTVNVTTVDLDPSTAGIQNTFTVGTQGTYTVVSSGVVTFTPVLDFNGTATAVNYTVQDNKGVASNVATITVTVTPVNDVPSFTVGVNQTVCVASGAQTINAWATGLSPGPANESAQTLSFNIASNSNSAIFSVQPSVSSTGVLTFTPSSTSGTATIALNIQDNGGTFNGGIDKSADQTFTINVNAAATVTPGGSLSACQSSSPSAITLSGASFGGSASTAAWTISTGGGTLSSTSQTATPAAVTYTPDANFSGTVTLTLTTNVPGICPAASGIRTINVNALPALYTVTGGGAYCSGSAGLPVGLSGSQIGVNYQLKRDGLTTVSSLNGTGSALSFGNQTIAGTYTVVATNVTTVCTTNMTGSAIVTINPLPIVTFTLGVPTACAGSTGNVYTTQGSMTNYVWTVSAGGTITAGGGSGNNTVTVTWNTAGSQSVSVNYSNGTLCTAVGATVYPVTVNALPTAYTVTGGGSYCTGGSGVAIGLSNSQSGVNYQLKLGLADVGGQVAGNGSALNFGLQTAAGTYTVVATNATSGCSATMTGSAIILINPLPAIFNVTGGGNYCNGGTGIAIGLSNSQPGVNYQLKIGASNAGSPLAGTGSALNFGNQTAAGTYTVVATNPTTGCSSTMSGTATVIIDPIPVITFSAGVSTACEGSTGNVYTTQSGMSNYIWLVSGGGTITSGGGPGNYTVTVTWNTAGSQSVSVIYINTNGCIAAIATVYPVTVNALPTVYNVTGGGPYCSGGTGLAVGLSDSQIGVNYQLKIGGVDTGGLIAGTGNPISFGNQTDAGTYTVSAINASTGCTSNMSGSAIISVNSLPTLYTVTGGGTDCTGSSALTVGLSGSQTGVSYQLRLGIADSGTPLAGTGSAISFGIKTIAGTYTVVATNTSTTCTANMSGSVTITLTPLPIAYTITGGGSYCAGGTGVTVGLNNSQSGVNYQLKIGGVNTGVPVSGTAGVISFGLQTVAGTYTVVGINAATSCSSNMTGSATVTINPLPTAYSVTGGGSYCSGGSGLAVGLSNSQSGVNYQLQLNSANSGSPVAGNGGALSFGVQAAAGSYTVIAINSVTGCTANMTGSVSITVNSLPTVYTVTGGGNYCSGGSGVAVGLNNSQNGINYQLQLGSVNTGTVVAGTGGAISFGLQTSAGIYTVVASNASTSCSANMTGSVTVVINPLPAVYSVTGGGTYCSGGSGAAVGLSNSQTGVNYQLKLGGVNDGSVVAGNGSAISFGVKTATGTYTVVATTVLTGCTSNMTGSVLISTNPLPTSFNVTGGGTDCSGGSGVVVGLSGSQTGVNYQLHIGGVNTGLPIAGTGSALNFGAQVTAGTYTIEATNASTGCISTMNGSVTVTVTALPTAFNVTGGGSYCSGGSGVVVGLSNSETGVNYQLRRGVIDVGSPVAGTASAISFGSQFIAGTYSVVATNASTACNSIMAGSVVVSINPLPTAYSVTGGGSFCTGGSGVAVGLSNSQIGENYQLLLGGLNSGIAVAGTGSAISFGIKTVAGTYTVIANNVSTGCSVNMTGSATVTVNPLPVLTLAGATSACAGTSGNVYTTQAGMSSYVWNVSAGGTITSGGGSGNNSVTVTWNTSGSQSVSVNYTNGNGCTATNPTNYSVTVSALPLTYNVTGGGSYCTGGTGLTVGLSNSQTGVNYQLQLSGVNNGSPLPGTGSPISFGNMTSAGIYTVVATNTSSLCTSSMTGSSTITINPLPVVTFTGGSPSTACEGSTGNVYSTQAGMSNYIWNVSAGGTITSGGGTGNNSVTVTWDNPGAQSVSVNYTNGNGCTAAIATSYPVTVNPLPTMVIATAATCALNLATYSVSVTVSSGTLTSTSGTVSHVGNLWTISAVPTGTNILLTLTDILSCAATLSITAPDCSCPVISAPVGGGDKEYCADASVPAITASVSAGVTVDWYNVPSGGTALATNTLSYTPSSAGDYYAEARNSTTNCKSSTRTAITIISNPVTGATSFTSGAITECQDAVDETYNAIAANSTSITYSVSPAGAGTINSSTGVMNWSALFSGTATITATATGICGITHADRVVTINATTGATSFTAGAITECQDAADETYTATAANNTSITYSVSPVAAGTINSSTGVMNWSALFSGTATITATATGLCGTTHADRIVTVNPTIGTTNFTAGAITVCQDAADETYTATAANNTSITYSVLPAGAGTINSSTGVMNWSASFSGTATITATATGLCGTTHADRVVTVNPSTGATSFNAGAITLCQDAADETYSATAANNTSITYSVLPAGAGTINSSTGVMNWSASYSGTATITATAAGLCGTTFADRLVTINPTTGATSFTAGAITECQDAADDTYTAIAANSSSITYSVLPAGAGTINSSTGVMNWSASFSGTATITAIATGLCGTTQADRLVTVNPSTGVTSFIAGSTTECQDAADGTYTATAANNTSITYSVLPAGAGTINSSTGVMNWSPSFSGTATITATATGLCGTTHADRAVTVNPTTGITTFTAGAIVLCQDAADETYTATSANSTSITFSVSPAGAGTIDSSTGVMNWSALFSGTATITATATGSCGTTHADRVVTVNSTIGATNFTAGAVIVCQDAADETYTAAAANSTSITYSVLPAGAGTINSSTGVMNWSATFSGTATITAHATGLCGTSSSTRTVTVNPSTGTTSFTAGATTICQNAADETYTATAANSTSIIYSVSPSGAGTINSSTGVMNWSASYSGIAIITATSTGLCGTTNATQSVTINNLPGVIAGSDRTICNGTSTTLGALPVSGSSYSWTSSPVGFTSNLANPTVSPSATTTYTVIETIIATGCSDSQSVLVNVDPLPVVSAPATVCVGSTITLSPVTGGTWSSSNNTVATVTNSGIASGVSSGTVTFTFTNTLTGCSATTSLVTVNQEPAFTSCPSDILQHTELNQCNALVLYSAVATGVPDPDITFNFTGATTGSGAGTGSSSVFNTGVTLVVITATNSCGTKTCSFNVTITDNEKPVIICPANITQTADAGVCGATISIPDPTATDNCSTSFIFTGVRSDALTLYDVYPVGTTTISWTATDVALNTSLSCNQTITVTDDEEPVIICPENILQTADAGICGASVTVINPTATDNCSTSFTFNGVRSDGLALSAVFPVGITTITWTATDAALNTSLSCSQSITVTDDEKPIITCPENITQNTDAGACEASVIITDPTATDNCSSIFTFAGVRSDLLALNALYPTGNTTITWTATDVAGNISLSCDQTITVTDHEKPVISCPASITQTADAGVCGAAIIITDPTATDNCSTSFVFAGVRSDALALSAVYPVGVTTINWTATDASGNISLSCTQTITITDNEKPVIVCPANILQTADSGICGASVSIANPTATDNCSSSFIFAGIRSDALELSAVYPVGITTIKWTATDLAGNTSLSCDQTVTVTDNEKPVITCPDQITQAVDAGVCGASVTLVDPTATDNCSASFTFIGTRSDALGLTSVYPVGTTTITWTATDAAGNVSESCLQEVKVTDNENPAAICKNVTINLDASGNASITADDINNNSTDNCGILSVVASKTSFTCSDIGENHVTLTVTDNSDNFSTCDALVTVTDTNAPTLFIGNISVNEIDGNAVFTVSISNPRTCDVTFTANTADNSALAATDYSPINNVSYTIPGGSTSVNVSVPITDDNVYEQTESFYVNLSNPENAVISVAQGICTILDDDAPPAITIDDASAIEGSDVIFPVTLSNPSSEDITLTFVLTNGTASSTDYNTADVTVTIPAGSITVNVVVPSVQDLIDEKDETFTIAVKSVDAGIVGDTGDTAIGTILDDENYPVAADDSATTAEDTPVTIDVLVNDIFGDDGPAVGPITANNGLHGTVKVNNGGTPSDPTDDKVVYTPNPNYTGTDSFTYSICDPTPDCSTATVSVTTSAVNDAPVAQNDVFNTFKDMPVSGNLMTNDSDPEGDALTIKTDAISSPTGGTLVIYPDGTFSYTPNSGYSGTDSFVYEVCDNGTPSLCSQATVTIKVIELKPSNNAPVANNDNYQGSVNLPVHGNVLSNDFDPDGDLNSTSVTLVGSVPAHGILILNPDGTFTFTPESGFLGLVSFVYQVCDLGFPVQCSTATVNIEILPNPTGNSTFAADDIFFGKEDQVISANVLTNDYDPQGDTQTVNTVPVSLPHHGTVLLNSNGSFTYTPVPNYNGTDWFIYQVCDNGTPTACDQAMVSLMIAPVNNAPVAKNDVATTFKNMPVGGNLLINDSDPDGNSLIIKTSPVTSPSHGTVSINSDGTFTYTPVSGYAGNDSFIYEVCDNGIPSLCDQAMVTIKIIDLKDSQNAPVANNDDYQGSINLPVHGNVISNDFDPDGDLNTNSVTLVGSVPAHGTLNLNTDGTFTFTPEAGFLGLVSFVYQVCDLGAPVQCGSATVSIEILPNPRGNSTFANDDIFFGREDQLITANVLANDYDPEGDVQTVNTVPVSLPLHGSVTLNANGSFTYTPVSNYGGTDRFVYSLCDSGTPKVCDQATVYLMIASVNDLPVANDDTNSTQEDQNIIGGNTASNDTQSGDGGNEWSLVGANGSASHGHVTMYSEGRYDYKPFANFNGTDTFTYQICDINGDCASAIVTITVIPVNDLPIANDDLETTQEDTPIIGADATVNDVLSGDGGNVWSLVGANGGAANGTVTMNADGTYNYIPNSNFSGSDSFTYQLCDSDGDCDQAIVSITVTAVNDVPVAVNDVITTLEDVSIIGASVTGNDIPSGDGGNVWSLVGVNGGAANGTVTMRADGTYDYDPDANFNGTDYFTYQLCDIDGDCDQARVTIFLSSVKDVPLAEDDVNSTVEDTPIIGATVASNDIQSGDGGNKWSLFGTNGGAMHGKVTMSADGKYNYTPDVNFVGTDTFIYLLCDFDTDCAGATVKITVTPVNDPPVAMDDINTTFMNMQVSGNVLTNDSDPEGNQLTIKTSPVTPPAHGSVIISPDGTYTYIPNSGFSGTDIFIYEICDNGIPSLCDQAKVTIKVIDYTGTNNAPVAINDAYQGSVGLPVKGNVISNDFDPDGNLNMNSVTVIGLDPKNGSFTMNPNGIFTYIPNAGFIGQVSFDYRICDLGTPALCDIATVTIDILANPEKNSTFATDDSYFGKEDKPISGNVLTNDNDPQGDAQTVNTSPVISPKHGVLILNSNGTFTYTPTPNYVGSDQFVYQVCDNGTPQACDQANVYLIIAPQNDPPVAEDDINMTFKDVPVSGNVLTNDSDPEGDLITINTKPAIPPTYGTVVINPDGTYTYTPNSGFSGTDIFVYEVCDNGSPVLCDQAKVTIKVIDISGTNNAPVAINDAYQGSVGLAVKGNVISNDFDPDGNLNPNSVTLIGSAPASGTLTLNPGGTFTYVPVAGFIGQVNFVYQICDLGTPALCDMATVTIEILANPNGNSTFATDDLFFGKEDNLITANVLTNDNDPQGDIQTVNPSAVVLPTHGSLVLNANGTFTYTPVPNYWGQDHFVYEVCDNGSPKACDQGTVYLIIAPQNDSPVAMDDINITLKEEPVSGNVLTNDSDPDGNLLTIKTTPSVDPQNGTVVISLDGTYTYTPNSGFSGTDSFIYEVCDNGIPSLCDQAKVTIKVIDLSGANNTPVAMNDAYQGSIGLPVKGNVISNDFDPDGNLNPNSVTLIGSAPASGALTLNTNGTFSYIPVAGFLGQVSFQYQICDLGTPALCDIATVTIEIQANPNGNSTFATDDSFIGNEDSPISGNVLTNDYDPQGDVQKVNTSPIVSPDHGTLILNANGTFSYTPIPNYNGTDHFVYEVCDNGTPTACDQATVYLIIKPFNDAPIAKDDIGITFKNKSLNGNLLTNDSDPEGDPLSIKSTPVSLPAHGSVVINLDGTYSYTPNSDFIGNDSFVYEVCDNGIPSLCDQATVSIKVIDITTATNSAPVANNDAYQGSVGYPVKGNVISNDFDPDGNLNPNSVTLNGSAPGNGSLTLNPNGTFTFIPVAGFIGQVSFQYSVCDIGTPALCDVAMVTIDILPNPTGNSTFATDDIFFGREDAILTGNVLSNDNDPEGNSQTVNTIPVIQTLHGALQLNTNGTFRYMPDPNFNGIDQFVYEVCDNGTPTACDQATVYLIFAPGNDLPVAVDDANSTDEEVAVSGNVSTNDTPSSDGGNIWTKVSEPAHGELVFNPDGSYAYTPEPNFNGIDKFIYRLCDVDTDCSEATVSITVKSINDLPVAYDDTISFHIDATLESTVAENDILSGDGGNIWSIVTPPANGTIVFNTDGTYTYTPNESFAGTDSFTYELCDANGDCDQAQVTITINDVIVVNQIFTPNGDGQNDTFHIEGIEFYPSSKLTIFNRWGNVVYQKSGYLNDWDGNSNKSSVGSSALSVGTYFYVLDYGIQLQKHKAGYIYLER